MPITAYTRDGRPKGAMPGYAPQGVSFLVNATGNSTGTTASTYVKVALPTKEFDPYNFFDATNYRWLPKIAGYYTFNAGVAFTGGSQTDATNLYAAFYKNGALVKRVGVDKSGTNNNSIIGGASPQIYLNGSTDYVELYALSGTTLSGAIPANAETWLSGSLVASSVGVTPEPWHYVGAAGEPAFLTGWANYPGGYQPLRFMKDPHGFVHVEGEIQASAGAAVDVFTLPAGYRPGVSFQEFPASYWNGSAYTLGIFQLRGSMAGTLPGTFRAYSSTGSAVTSGWIYQVNSLLYKAES